MRQGIKLSAAVMLGAGLVCNSGYAVKNTSMQTENTSSAMQTNEAAGVAFLAANAKEPGVVTLPDGLQYKEITKGNGANPTDSDTVVVDYSGTLINGKEFDSSYKRGQPATFQVSAVIPGWTEALKLMKPGATWKLFIPASLAYGAQGVPGEAGQAPVIGPNEVLIFQVHLISVKK